MKNSLRSVFQHLLDLLLLLDPSQRDRRQLLGRLVAVDIVLMMALVSAVDAQPLVGLLRLDLPVGGDDGDLLFRREVEEHVVEHQAVLVELLEQPAVKFDVLHRHGSPLAGPGLAVELEGDGHGVPHGSDDRLNLLRLHQLPRHVTFGQGGQLAELPVVLGRQGLFRNCKSGRKNP